VELATEEAALRFVRAELPPSRERRLEGAFSLFDLAVESLVEP
jgi:hypothetical protein